VGHFLKRISLLSLLFLTFPVIYSEGDKERERGRRGDKESPCSLWSKD